MSALRIGDIVGFVTRPEAPEPVPTYPDLWHILVVHEKTERVVQRSAQLAGLDAWYPERAFWSSKTKRQPQARRLLAPLFPGYVFARAPKGCWIGDTIKRLPETVEVRRNGEVKVVPTGIVVAIGALMMDGRLLGVDDAEIARLRERQAGGEFDEAKETSTPGNPHGFVPGDRVMINDGPFASFPAVVIEVDDLAGRAAVEINIFGRATETRLPLDDLRPFGLSR